MGRPLIDLTGQRFGKWTVVRRETEVGAKSVRWVCRCDCGTARSVFRQNLVQGTSVQCRSCANRRRRKGEA